MEPAIAKPVDHSTYECRLFESDFQYNSDEPTEKPAMLDSEVSGIEISNGVLQDRLLYCLSEANYASKISGIVFESIQYSGQLFSNFFNSLNANRSIRVLNLTNSVLDETSWQIFVDALSVNNTIRTLEINYSNKELKLKQSVTQLLAKALSKNQFLRTFKYKGVCDEDHLDELCRNLIMHKKINTLDLSGDNFSYTCIFLMLALKSLHSVSLKFKTFFEMPSLLADHHLAPVLAFQKGLREIHLEDGISNLTDHHSVITSLAKLPSLRILKILRPIDAEGLDTEFLFNSFSQSSSIQTLEIRTDKVSGKALQALGFLLSKNYTLQSLCIKATHFQINDDDLVLFSKALARHPTLSSLILKNLGENVSQVGDLGLYAIFSSLSSIMTNLDIFAPKATFEGMCNVIKLLENHHAISYPSIEDLPEFPEHGVVDLFGVTDAHYYRRWNDTQMAPLLRRNDQLYKSLIEAFYKRDHQKFGELIDSGAGVQNCDGDFYFLHEAVAEQDPHIAEILVNSPYGPSLLGRVAPYNKTDRLQGWLTPLEAAQSLGLKEMSDFLETAQKKDLQSLSISTKRRAATFEEWALQRPYQRKESVLETVRVKLAPPQNLSDLRSELQQQIQKVEQSAKPSIESHAIESRKRQTLRELKEAINGVPEQKLYFQALRERLDSTIHSLRSAKGGFTEATNGKETLIDLGGDLAIAAGILVGGLSGAGIEIVVMFGGHILKAINQMTILRLARNAVTLFPNSSTTGNLIEIIALLMTQRHHADILNPPSISKMSAFNRFALYIKAKLNGYDKYTDLDFLAALHLATFIELIGTLDPELATKDVDLTQAILNGFGKDTPLDPKIVELLSHN